MENLYWITRLDALHGMFVACIVFAGLTLAVYFIGLGMASSESAAEGKLWKNFWKHARRIVFTILIVGILGNIFLPTKKDAFLIWGGGTILEYVENNKDLQEIPDNVSKALRLWSEEFLEDQQHSE